MKLSTCIGVKLGEGKNIFIEDNVSGDIYATSGNIETLVPFMRQTISKEHAPFGTEFKLPSVIWREMWPASTAKDLKPRIIRC
jgi:hypothetical protein